MDKKRFKKGRKKKKRKSALTSASTILDYLLYRKKTNLANQFKRRLLWHEWKEIMGPTIYNHSHPVGYSNGKLFVAVDNSARLQEMSFLEPVMREKINEFIGYKWVKSVRLTLDKRDEFFGHFKPKPKTSVSKTFALKI